MNIRPGTRALCLGALSLGVAIAGCHTPSPGSPFSRFSKNDPQPQGPQGLNQEQFVHSGKLKQPAKMHVAYARWQEQVGNLSEARNSYEKALGEDPKSVDAIVGVARLDQLAERPREAEKGFRKALSLDSGNAQTLDALGQFYVTQDRFSEAIPVLQRANQISPNENTIRFHLGVAHARAGNKQEAMRHFVASVGEAEAHYNLGYLFYEEGQVREAEAHFAKAVELKPGLAAAQEMLAEIRGTAPAGATQVAQAAYQSAQHQSRQATQAVYQAPPNSPRQDAQAPADPYAAGVTPTITPAGGSASGPVASANSRAGAPSGSARASQWQHGTGAGHGESAAVVTGSPQGPTGNAVTLPPPFSQAPMQIPVNSAALLTPEQREQIQNQRQPEQWPGRLPYPSY